MITRHRDAVLEVFVGQWGFLRPCHHARGRSQRVHEDDEVPFSVARSAIFGIVASKLSGREPPNAVLARQSLLADFFVVL